MSKGLVRIFCIYRAGGQAEKSRPNGRDGHQPYHLRCVGVVCGGVVNITLCVLCIQYRRQSSRRMPYFTFPKIVFDGTIRHNMRIILFAIRM